MNIAHIIPHSVSYPLKSHNGRYEWVRQLAQLQVKQGHTVTIYGGPHSQIEGITFSSIDNPSSDKRKNNIDTFLLAFKGPHDVFHSHFDDLHYLVAQETKKPIVFTQHWWPTETTIEYAERNPGNVWAVPPTQFMHEFDIQSGIQTQGFIYHGIDLSVFHKTTSKTTDRLLFVGRISPEKNLHIAIRTALLAGAKLDIVGKVVAKNQTYWESLKEYIDGDTIRYLGPKSQTELVELYSSARGALCPFEPTEPFGLVAIEAQACGTPIIMKKGGSRGELVDEGVTGYLCETDEEFVKAIQSVAALDSEKCVTFAQKFNIHTMAGFYEQLYQSLQ